MSVELKIKVKNLMDEARTIRQEEQKLHGMEKWKLQHHRKTVVRDAARRSQVAYLMCKGSDHWRDAASCDEHICWRDWPHVEKMIKKYGKAEAVDSLPKLERQFKGECPHKPVLSGDHDNAEDACSNAA